MWPGGNSKDKTLELVQYKLRPGLAGTGRAGANALLILLALFQAVRDCPNLARYGIFSKIPNFTLL